MSIKYISVSKDPNIKINTKTTNNNQPTKLNLSNQAPIRIKTVSNNTIQMEIIKEKDNENASTDKINSYISNVRKNRLLSVSSNQKNINLQDMDSDYLNNFNNARKIHPMKPFIDEINNIENDQLKNTSTEGIFESEFESESLKEIDPYISYDASFLNKNKILNSKYKNNHKNKKNSPLNTLKFYRYRGNSDNHNKINSNKYKSINHKKTNTIQSDKKPRKYLGYFNLKCRSDFCVNYELEKKIHKKKLTENLAPRKSFNYCTIDFSKIDNFKSNKKRDFEKQKMLKIKKIKNLRNYDKKFKNDSKGYNSEVNFSLKHTSNLDPNFNEIVTKKTYKEKKEMPVPRNQTDYGAEFSILKENFIKLNTFNYIFKNNLENKQKTNNRLNNRLNNKLNNKSKSNHPKKKDTTYNNSNIDLIKIKMNKYLVKRTQTKKSNKRNSSSCNKKEERKRYQSNPFINESFNSITIGNENNNNTILSRVISIIDKKLGYMDKPRNNVKIRNQKLRKK